MADIVSWDGDEALRPMVERVALRFPQIKITHVCMFDLGEQLGFVVSNGKHRRAGRMLHRGGNDDDFAQCVQSIIDQLEAKTVASNG